MPGKNKCDISATYPGFVSIAQRSKKTHGANAPLRHPSRPQCVLRLARAVGILGRSPGVHSETRGAAQIKTPSLRRPSSFLDNRKRNLGTVRRVITLTTPLIPLPGLPQAYVPP